jgi:hypothetical protein
MSKRSMLFEIYGQNYTLQILRGLTLKACAQQHSAANHIPKATISSSSRGSTSIEVVLSTYLRSACKVGMYVCMYLALGEIMSALRRRFTKPLAWNPKFPASEHP